MGDRNIYDVCNRLLAEIPETEGGVRTDVMIIQKKAMYTAPELMPSLWATLAYFLNSGLPFPPQTDWQWKVAAIIRGHESVEDCKRIVAEGIESLKERTDGK